jgi:membrane protease YdiL (CAAX protease family)
LRFWRAADNAGPVERSSDPARRRLLWFEILAVLCVLVLPAYLGGIRLYLHPRRPLEGFAEDQAFRIFGTLFALMPVLYIAWRSGEGLTRFGLVRFRPMRDIALATAVFFTDRALTVGLVRLCRWLLPMVAAASTSVHKTNLRPGPNGAWEISLLLLAQFLNAAMEEFTIRGYLIPRLEELTGKSWLALVLSSAIFAGYHIYQGPVIAATILLTGMLLGLSFLLTRSVWPGVMAHMANNVFSYIVRSLS